MTKETDDKDLIIIALKQRIGELVSNYESHIANLRVEYTKLEEKSKELTSISNSLIERLSKYEEKSETDKIPSVDDILKED